MNHHHQSLSFTNNRKQVRRCLTTRALNIFVHHYFSFPWLRQYLLERRVYHFVKGKEKDDMDWELELFLFDAFEPPQSFKEDRLQVYFDLLFLVRTAHERNPTAELLQEIMMHFTALEGNMALIKNKNDLTSALNSTYFAVALSQKISTMPKGNLVDSWKRVARIPFKYLLERDCYARAKTAELKALGYFTDEELPESEIYDDLQKEFAQKWLETDCRLRIVLERKKSKKDLVKYYHSLSQEAKNLGNVKLSEIWMTVIYHEEKTGECPDETVLMAWALQRIASHALPAGIILLWQRTVDIINKQQSAHSLYNRTALLALEFEKTIVEINKVERQLLTITTSSKYNDPCIHDLQELISDFPSIFRAQLLKLPLQLKETVTNEDVNLLESSFRVLKDSLKPFAAEWIKLVDSLLDIVKFRDDLFQFYTDCPDIITVVETRFRYYYDELHKHFTDQKVTMKQVSKYSCMNSGKHESLRRYLLIFPYKKELYYHSTKYRETGTEFSDFSFAGASIHLEVIQSILKLQEFINNHYPAFQTKLKKGEFGNTNTNFENSQFLDKVNFALNILQRSDISELKKQLSLEYLQCCLKLLPVEITYRKPCFPTTILLAVQEKLTNLVDLSTTSLNEIECWRKALELLEKVPRIEKIFFKSRVVWMIHQLLAGKAVDVLLFQSVSCVQLLRKEDHFHASLKLLQYYLPQKYFAQIEEVIIEIANPIQQINDQSSVSNRQLKPELVVMMDYIFTGQFFPKEEHVNAACFTPYIYFLPILRAYQRNKLGLLLEWKSWIQNRRHKTHNLFREKLQEAFQNDSLFPSFRTDDYHQLDLYVVSDNLVEQWNPGEIHSDHGEIEYNIRTTARRFLGKSAELLKNDGIIAGNSLKEEESTVDLVFTNCLQVSALYLEFMEIDHSFPLTEQQRFVEFKRIYKQMTKLVREKAIVKK
jgi:hypothetical protein